MVGTTFTGACDDVLSLDAAVENYGQSQRARELNIDIPIHVDAASGGFVTLFAHNGQEVRYRFNETQHVLSINVSNHKFGMTFPGMGSVVFKDKSVVDPSLIYNITYLGGSFMDYTVNFSRGSSMILMQYYNFLNFGRVGYQKIMDNCLANTAYFIEALQRSAVLAKYFQNISDAVHLPILILTWAEGIKRPDWNLTDLSDQLRRHGWVVPAYTLPQLAPDQVLQPEAGVQVLRVVVQQVVTRDKLSRLILDLEATVQTLEEGVGLGNKNKRWCTCGYRC